MALCLGACINLVRLFPPQWQYVTDRLVGNIAPESLRNINVEVLSLLAVLTEIAENTSARPLPPEKQARLRTVVDGCASVLTGLQSFGG